MARRPPSVATQFFRDIKPNDVFNSKLNDRTLVSIAIKLFLIAYPEFDTGMYDKKSERFSQLFTDQLNQYIETLRDLFGAIYPPNDLVQLIDAFHSSKLPKYVLTITVKRFVHSNTSRTLKLRVGIIRPKKSLGRVKLDHKTEVQTNKVIKAKFSYKKFKQMRLNGIELSIKVKRGRRFCWPRVREPQYERFRISCSHIHPEGYQQWHDFGHDIQLLIEITYGPESSAGRRVEAIDFHLICIERMVARRLAIYGDQSRSKVATWHKHLVRSNCISFDRPLVASDQMFWRRGSDSNEGWMRTMKEFSERQSLGEGMPKLSDIVGRVVLYTDLHRVADEDKEESVCLCNEWCNWSAFFFYNPIYRFIIIQNSQQYMINRTNIPEIYLSASAMNIKQQTGQRQTTKAYLTIQLIRSANEYRMYYKSEHIMVNPTLEVRYTDSYPIPGMMIGLVYKILRLDTQIAKLCHQFDERNPLSDFCVKNLVNYFQVLNDLHIECAEYEDLVLQTDHKDWFKEYEVLSRQVIGNFFIDGCKKMLASIPAPQPEDIKDRIFGNDPEYLQFVATGLDEIIIKERRAHINYWDASGLANSLNVSVLIHPFVNCFIKAYKFFATIEMQFSSVECRKALEAISNYCQQFDKHFEQSYKPNDSMIFIVSEEEMVSLGMDETSHKLLIIFYTLKLYSFGFVMQKHCIRDRARLLYYTIHKHTDSQIADYFQFIFNKSTIEETCRRVVDPKGLFPDSDRIEALYEDFYITFWKKAYHEKTVQTTDVRQNCDSALRQYFKLYLWLKLGGNQKRKFTELVAEAGVSFERTVNSCVHIFDAYIITGIGLELRPQYVERIEVMDRLVLYLVRASCYRFIQSVAQLFRLMHSNQDSRLCESKMSFSMGKPGWTQLLATYDRLSAPIDRLRTSYIVYDDELERIADSLFDTQLLVKQFYRYLFFKLSREWISELYVVVTNTSRLSPFDTVAQQLIAMQLVVGLAFSVAFVHRFRDFDVLRQFLFSSLSPSGPRLNLQLRGWQIKVTNYLKDGPSVRSGLSFESPIWKQYIENLIPSLKNISPLDVSLDMSSADVVVDDPPNI